MKLAQALLGLTLAAWLVCESEQFGKPMGPYNVIVQQAMACDDQGTGQTNFDIHLYLGDPDAARRRKRLHRGSFLWPFTKEETDRMEIHADIFHKKSDNFMLMYKYREKLCPTLSDIAHETYDTLREAMGIDHPEGCYMPVGNHTFENWDIPFKLPTPMLEYGSYKAIANVLLDDNIFECFIIICNVVPK